MPSTRWQSACPGQPGPTHGLKSVLLADPSFLACGRQGMRAQQSLHPLRRLSAFVPYMHMQVDSHDGAYYNCWCIGGRSGEQGEHDTWVQTSVL
jgi:hypothetical protein